MQASYPRGRDLVAFPCDEVIYARKASLDPIRPSLPSCPLFLPFSRVRSSVIPPFLYRYRFGKFARVAASCLFGKDKGIKGRGIRDKVMSVDMENNQYCPLRRFVTSSTISLEADLVNQNHILNTQTVSPSSCTSQTNHPRTCQQTHPNLDLRLPWPTARP